MFMCDSEPKRFTPNPKNSLSDEKRLLRIEAVTFKYFGFC